VRLTVVGCAGSFPSPDSPASCYLLEADDDEGRTWRIVLDLGSGAVGPLQRYAPLGALDAVLFSHLHPDHFIDVCALYVALHYAPGGPAPVPLRCTARAGPPTGSGRPTAGSPPGWTPPSRSTSSPMASRSTSAR